MVDDWAFALDVTMAHDTIGTRQLAYFGLSMGSAFGIPMMASRNDVIVSTIGLLGTSGAIGAWAEAFLEAAAKITHPTFYIMQLEDELFDRAGCLELFDAIASEDKRLHANPGEHPEVPLEEIVFAYDFMKSHIEGTAQRRIVNPLAD